VLSVDVNPIRLESYLSCSRPFVRKRRHHRPDVGRRRAAEALMLRFNRETAFDTSFKPCAFKAAAGSGLV
jgi:hypothetical protein